MQKQIRVVIMGMLITSTLMLAQVQKYSRVKIYANDSELHQLIAAGLAVDHGEHKKGIYFISDFSAGDINILKANGAKYEILIDDVSNYYIDQNKTGLQPKTESLQAMPSCSKMPAYPTPAGFTLGSMGGYFTYDEIMAHLDTMAAKYPNLFKAKMPVSATKTIEGRDVYWVKISDNVNTDELEPEVLYTALHHAREPNSVSQLIMYMYYLLENYTTDPHVKYLVDNTEMYFIPCINPDGYIYNHSTNPNGGGMFRKNRRNNGDGTYGVDLNRNYGQNWGYDNIGSSNNTNSDSYRGTSAFSEPETQIVKEFCMAHQFKITLNHHTYGDLLIYPWGYEQHLLTPDSMVFKNYAALMTHENGFKYGTSEETVAYVVNGSSDDWMYGDQTDKPKIIAMTAEAGDPSLGFWPAQNLIVDICKSDIPQNIHVAELATKYATAKEKTAKIVSALNNYAVYDIQRLGLDSPATFTVSIIPVSANIIGTGSAKSYGNMNLLETRTDSIAYTLVSTINPGDKVVFVVSVSNGAYSVNDTLTKIFGTPVVAYSTTANSMSGWVSTTWGTSSTIYHSATASITDSPSGNYPNNSTRTITKSSAINLTDAIYAELNFWARWELEVNYDYTEVDASDDGGTTWTPLCGKYTRIGNGNQNTGNPVYDGYQYNWLKESMDLSDYIGKNILLRFETVSDQYTNYDGFYFDDLSISKIITSPSGINSNELNDRLQVQINPNPVNGTAIINFSLPTNCLEGNLVLFDAMGRIVERRVLVAGQSNLSINTEAFTGGIYYYRLTSKNFTSTVKKLVVVK